MIKTMREAAAATAVRPVPLPDGCVARFAADCGMPARPYTISPMKPP